MFSYFVRFFSESYAMPTFAKICSMLNIIELVIYCNQVSVILNCPRTNVSPRYDNYQW